MLGLVLSKTGHEAEGDGSLTKELSFPFVGGQGGGGPGVANTKGGLPSWFSPDVPESRVCHSCISPPARGLGGRSFTISDTRPEK